MNGFKMMADNYRILWVQGKIDEDEAEKKIRIYDFLATCDTDDFCQMVDSSAFNDIIKAYVESAVDDSDINEDEKQKVKRNIHWLFDEKSAKTVLKKYGYL